MASLFESGVQRNPGPRPSHLGPIDAGGFEGASREPYEHRGVGTSYITEDVLTAARQLSRRFDLPGALGLTSPLDQEGLIYLLALRRAKHYIDHEDRQLANTPNARKDGLDTVQGQLNAMIAAYKQDQGFVGSPDRPHHIDLGINEILTHLRVDPPRTSFWHRRRDERAWARKIGEDWRGRLAAKPSPAPSAVR